MRPFELVKPDSLAEALRRAEPGTLLKAAGIDVLDRLKERIEEPAKLLDLMELRRDLAGIRADGGGVRIGALTTLRAIADAKECEAPAFAALTDAASRTATPQIRNRATAGGNLLQLTRCWYLRSAAFTCAHGGDGPDCLAQTGENRYHSIMRGIDCFRVHPSNLAPALIALDAKVVVRGADAERTISLIELYPEEPYAEAPEHTLAQGEILTEIVVPAQPANAKSAYRDSREKLAFDWPTTAAAVRIALEGGVVKDARICLGAVAPIPVFSPEAAALLVGEKPSDALFRRVADKAYEGAEPLEQNAYKVELGKNVLCEALRAATGS